ncbi:MAG TPA: hypothetical protein VGG89_07510 [Candidatus Baltobacteraceae bacterium]|jgi:predicted protein tyrosine phosphatase
MLEHVFSTSRAYAEEFSWQEPFAIISICDPDSPAPTLRSRNLVARLDLRFLDLDRDYEDSRVVFTIEMAHETLHFVQRRCRNAKMLLVHCEAGVSRSTAIASALGAALGVEVRHQNADYVSPNPLVSQLMAEAIASQAPTPG